MSAGYYQEKQRKASKKGLERYQDLFEEEKQQIMSIFS